jgi:hypothetical protein
MREKILYPFITGILILAVGASAKAIVEVQIQEAKIETFKELLYEVRQDVKDIKRILRR